MANRLLDGPAKQNRLLNVGVATPVEVREGSSALEERQAVTLQSTRLDAPNAGPFYVYFADDGETPSQADVQNFGFRQPKESIRTYEVGQSQAIWVLSLSGNIHIRFAERA